VVDSFEGGYRVEYDNQEREDVDGENVSPAVPPVAFGEESTPLAEREFCEVFNESETDPSAWLAYVYKAEEDHYTISFPFHDSEPERVPASRVCRARVFDEISRTWKVIKPGQEWEDGEISSPNELELIDESTLQSAVASLSKLEGAVRKSDGQKYKKMGSIVNGIQKEQAAAGAAASAEQQQGQLSEMIPHFQGRESRRRTKRKDPNAPKKPRSAYVFFMEKERKVVKEEDATLRPQHIMKVVGEKWAKLTNEEKEDYEEMAKNDRARYLEEMKEYTPPDMPLDEPGAKRVKKDDLPKRPMTAFMFFSKELRQKLGKEMNSVEKTKKIADTWREMTDEQKELYQGLAKEDKERYDRELAEMEAEALEQAKQQQAVMMKSFAEVTSIGFQPPPLTRSGAPVHVLDEEARKTLEEFDVDKVRNEITEQFVDDAYYRLLDVWREGSQRLGDAMRAYKAHIAGHEHPDWRAFFTSIFGVESTVGLLKSSVQPPEPAEPEEPAGPEVSLPEQK